MKSAFVSVVLMGGFSVCGGVEIAGSHNLLGQQQIAKLSLLERNVNVYLGRMGFHL